MADILHRIEISASPGQVYAALTEEKGLASWWTRSTKAVPEVGSVAQFRFSDGGPDMRITELEPNSRVGWECIDGPLEWIGTRFTFELTAEDDRTVLHFGQRGWREAGDFFMHCNCKWGYFLTSLKFYAEQGRGTPYPEDLDI
jgi:uncharacterized protein YndB with AHSA1/START domain